MANTIPLEDWLEVMDAEYLSSFVPNGGASVKFAVASDELKVELHSAMRERYARGWNGPGAPRRGFQAGPHAAGPVPRPRIVRRLACDGQEDDPQAGSRESLRGRWHRPAVRWQRVRGNRRSQRAGAPVCAKQSAAPRSKNAYIANLSWRGTSGLP